MEKKIAEFNIKIRKLKKNLERCYFWLPFFRYFCDENGRFRMKRTAVLLILYLAYLLISFINLDPLTRRIYYIIAGLGLLYLILLYLLQDKIHDLNLEINDLREDRKEFEKEARKKLK